MLVYYYYKCLGFSIKHCIHYSSFNILFPGFFLFTRNVCGIFSNQIDFFLYFTMPFGIENKHQTFYIIHGL